MKKNYLNFLFAIIIITTVSCTTYRFQQIFPAFYPYSDSEADELIPTDSIPFELISNLPVDFQLSYYSGHVWCYADRQGKIKLLKANPLVQKAKLGNAFKSRLRAALSDDRFSVFTPIAYPNVFCVMPNESIDSLMDENYFNYWLRFIDQWQVRELEILALDSSYQRTIIANEDVKKQIIVVNSEIDNYRKNIRDTERNIQAIISEINRKRAALGIPPLAVEVFGTLSFGNASGDPPPFDLRIGYNIDRDPFIDVVRTYTKDISDRTWASNQMEGGKFMDAELANKVQEINNKFDHPEIIQDASLAKDVQDLKELGFSGIKVTSGARTPFRQADLYSKAKRNKNPVGKYTKSGHMFGQAADMSLPDGWGWGTSNHNKLRSLMSKMGVAMNVANDPVHFSLASPTVGARAQRLAMARAYAAKANEIRNAQGAVKENQIFNKEKIAEQKDQLTKDLSNRQKELEDQAWIFDKVSAKYIQKQRELQDLNAELERREAERRRQEEQRNRQREREPRGGRPSREFERGDVSSPSQERPKPERPRRDPPAREPRLAPREPRILG